MRRLAIFVSCILLGTAGAASGQQLRIVDDPMSGEFLDITLIGTPLELGDDGSASLGVATFKGNFVFRPGTVVAGQNGGIGFGNRTVTPLEPINQPIPSADAFIGGQAALAFWDDIDDKDGDVFFHELTDHPVLGNRLIVQWNHHNFDAMGSTLMAQVQITDNFAPTGIYAQFLYEIDGTPDGAGSSATIGYQDGRSGFNYVEFSFNTPEAVAHGTVLSLFLAVPADLDGDGHVGTGDLLQLLSDWGACKNCLPCYADLDGDCVVGTADLLSLLDAWG